MGEMADYHAEDDSIEEWSERHGGVQLRIFVVCYENGNFHSMTTNQDIAYETADRISGILGELTNVHKPLKERDIPEPTRSAIIHALEHPESRVRRERPKAA